MRKYLFFGILMIIQCTFVYQGNLYAEVAINDACIQYRTYSSELKESNYLGHLRFQENNQPLTSDCIEQISLQDSTGNSVEIETDYEMYEYYWGEWNKSSQQIEYHDTKIYTGYAVTFPSDADLPSGNYTFIATTNEGQSVRHTLFYPGKTESPIVPEQSIDYHWNSDASLNLNWSKPTENFDKFKLIFGADKDKGKLFFVELPNELNALTIPSETAEIMRDLCRGSRMPFSLQTMKYSPENKMNYSEGITRSSLLLGNITQISDNDYEDKYPSLNSGQIAWIATTDYETGGPLINSLELYYYDGISINQLDSFGGYPGYCSLYNGHIAYVKGSISLYFQIKYYDGTSISQVSDKIIGNEFFGSQSPKPSLYNGKIAWHEFDGEDYEIFYYNGSGIIQITDNNLDDTYPSLHDGQLAWVAGGDIYYGKIFKSGEISIGRITENKNISKHNQPSLHNGHIAWSDHNEIYYYDGAAISQITDNNLDDGHPSLHNGHIAWSANGEIYYFDGSSITQITDNDSADRFPSLHDGNIAWHGYDNDIKDYEIFYYESAFKDKSDDGSGDDKVSGGDSGCFLKSF